jgi:type IV secretion system protein VirD4
MSNNNLTISGGHPGKQPIEKGKRGLTVRLLGGLSVVSGLQVATQKFAEIFQYHTALGSHYSYIYPPWRIVEWFLQWSDQYPEYLIKSGSYGVMVAGGGLFLTIIFDTMLSNSSYSDKYLHGSARWAERDDIKNAGLLENNEGVYVGAWEDKQGNIHYLRHNGPEHILTYAPTRSGKGVSLVMPTLLSWPHSAVITDIKGELFAMTAGWRKKYANNSIIKYEPASPTNDIAWNCLDEIRLDTGQEVGDVQNLATIIVDPDGKGLEDHWQKTAQSLLVGVILHVLYKSRREGTPATLPYVDKLLSPTEKSVSSLWLEMTQYPHVDGKTHHAVSSAARDMLDRPEEEAGSVLSTTKSYLSLYRDPVVAKNISASNFRVKDLMDYDNPVSLYIITNPTDKDRLKPLVRIMLNMIVRVLADKMAYDRIAVYSGWRGWLARLGLPITPRYVVKQTHAHKHRLLGMLDEFPSLGRLGIMEDALAHVAGYGIKFYLICQDISQLKSTKFGYGADETITANCHIQNAFPPNKVETAEHLSKLTGETTVVKEEITTSGRRQGAWLGQVSKRLHEIKRPLLTVDECLRLPGAKKDKAGQIVEAGDMVVYVAGFPAIYGKQPLYFKDPIFTARAAIPPPESSDVLRSPRNQAAGERIRLRTT